MSEGRHGYQLCKCCATSNEWKFIWTCYWTSFSNALSTGYNVLLLCFYYTSLSSHICTGKKLHQCIFFLVKDGSGNNSASVDLQRMDGSTFRYSARQNTFQPVIITNLCQVIWIYSFISAQDWMISQLLAFLFAGINATKFYKHTGENVGTFHQRPRDSYNKLSQQPHEGQGYHWQWRRRFFLIGCSNILVILELIRR